MFKKLSLVIACLLMFAVTPVLAQVDYCEGNFDNDLDQDGTDAFVFKQDFGRSSLLDPCPVIECQTAEQLEMRIVQLETQLTTVTSQLSNVTALLANVTRVGNDITFSGVNLQIVDGSGDTEGTANGLGNLIVGYNELRGSGDDRTGSHNIVVGSRHNYSSYGGLVAGDRNTIAGAYASVSGGVANTASGTYASVSGGRENTASGVSASVSGGRYNSASGDYSFVGGGGYTDGFDGNIAFGNYSAILGGRGNIAGDPVLTNHIIGQSSTVSGGYNNTASAANASVGGGHYNEANGIYSSVSGGRDNTASGDFASVSGGGYNTASGVSASVSGGRYNTASGEYSFVGGGGASSSVYGNTAFSHYSAVIGGRENITGDPNLIDHTIGIQSSVTGGYGNNASGQYSSVSGGQNRSATGTYDWAAGSLLENY